MLSIIYCQPSLSILQLKGLQITTGFSLASFSGQRYFQNPIESITRKNYCYIISAENACERNTVE